MDKAIRRVTNLDEQEAESYRYWQSLSVGDRLAAVCELSEAAYAFAANFNGTPAHDRPLARIQRKRTFPNSCR
jgi:hypothetical protein